MAGNGVEGDEVGGGAAVEQEMVAGLVWFRLGRLGFC